MARKYGSSLRWRVVFLHVTHHLSPGEIVRLLKVGKTFVHKVLKLYSETKGVEYSLNHNRGKPRSIGGRVILLIRYLIDQYPELYLDELRDWIYFRTGETYAIPTLSRCLSKIGLSVKKLQLIAKERDERRRANFRRYMAQFNKHELLFVDESSKDNRTFQRKYAQGLKGIRVSRKGNFTRGTRYSVLGAIAVDDVKAAHAIEGAYNKQQFEYAMEHFVLPHVGSYANKEMCSVIVMDNCRIHYSQRVFELVRRKGGMTVFLPPYSPDMNPIELCFGCGKSWLQRHQDVCDKYPKRCFEIALHQVIKPFAVPLLISKTLFARNTALLE
ncbi:uncharacterized protein [Acropora muricata]|uniref:uncharacterized protein n=1 Tax=Acropora muricata TaxID=159855 RepID=UPI0034E5B19D